MRCLVLSGCGDGKIEKPTKWQAFRLILGCRFKNHVLPSERDYYMSNLPIMQILTVG